MGSAGLPDRFRAHPKCASHFGFGLGCVDISLQPDESSSEMKEAKVSGVQLLKPGEDPAVMLYFVDEAFDQMRLPV